MTRDVHLSRATTVVDLSTSVIRTLSPCFHYICVLDPDDYVNRARRYNDNKPPWPFAKVAADEN